MSQLNCTSENRSGKYLSERERYQIEILFREKMCANEIAGCLGRNRRTIEREIQRGQIELKRSDLTTYTTYCADVAQRKYIENGSNKGPTLKIAKDHKLAKHIENKIRKEKYSPDAVIGEIKAKGIFFEGMICTKTLYNYIDKNVFANISNKDLPVKKNKKKKNYKKVKIALNNLRGTSIEERPKSIDARDVYGHWEMDCVVGGRGGSSAVLLVLTERATREEIIRKMPNKTQESVVKILDELEKKYKKKFAEKFKTITVDNGTEFLNSKGIEGSVVDAKKQRVKLYYAHPYSSWERGSNENANKLIRRFIPKGADISKISKQAIKRIEQWLNNYPRRIFGYKTANQMAS